MTSLWKPERKSLQRQCVEHCSWMTRNNCPFTACPQGPMTGHWHWSPLAAQSEPQRQCWFRACPRPCSRCWISKKAPALIHPLSIWCLDVHTCVLLYWLHWLGNEGKSSGWPELSISFYNKSFPSVRQTVLNTAPELSFNSHNHHRGIEKDTAGTVSSTMVVIIRLLLTSFFN